MRPATVPLSSTRSTASRIAYGEAAPSSITGGATSTVTATSEPMKAPAETSSSASTETSRNGSATNGISADRERGDQHERAEALPVRMAVGEPAAEPVADRQRDEHDADHVRPHDRRGAEERRHQPGGRDLGAERRRPDDEHEQPERREVAGGGSLHAGSDLRRGYHRRDVRPPASRPRLAPVHPDAGLRGRGGARDRAGRGRVARRHRGPPLHRRRLVAVVQRPRPPPPAHRRRGARAARPRRAHDDARPLAPGARSRAGAAPRRRSRRAALSRVFYSDSGSTAVEVALKMAFQYWQQAADARPSRTSFVCLENAYHGDTVGSVSVGGIDLFHSIYRPLLFDSHRVPAGDAAALEQRARRARRRDRGGRRRAAGAGRGRDAAPAARLPARGPRAVRPPRRLPDLRRGRDRLRPHGDDVRLRAGGRRAGLPVSREGPHRRLPAARRDAHHRARLRRASSASTRSSGPSSTATPTRATRSPARPRSRRSTCSSRSARSSGWRPRSRCSASCCATWSSRCRTWRRCAGSASCAASSWPTATGGPTTRRCGWATA